MNVLVTAGPTREHFDDVWFLSNPSSGRMGYAVAEVFAEAGHRVTLVSGPTALTTPEGVVLVPVTSTRELLDAVTQHLEGTDVVIMAAAPVDYRPIRRLPGKMKKTADNMVMELVRNPDILQEIGQRKGGRIHVGFALEATDARQHALDKLKAKNLDFIVANSPASFAADRTSVDIIGRDGSVQTLTDVTKHELARRLLRIVTQTAGSRKP